jgi:hypothetical protein
VSKAEATDSTAHPFDTLEQLDWIIGTCWQVIEDDFFDDLSAAMIANVTLTDALEAANLLAPGPEGIFTEVERWNRRIL